MEKKLKLYVWESVLADYTDGIAFAFAPSIKEAKAQLIKAGLRENIWNGYLLEGQKAQVFSKPKAFYVYGGG